MDRPYLWLDVTSLKVRDGGRIASVAAIIAVAVNTEGRRDIDVPGIGPSEAEPFWSAFLKSLVKRGLKGVKLVIPDAHDGLSPAIGAITPNGLAGAPISSCSVVGATVLSGQTRRDPCGRIRHSCQHDRGLRPATSNNKGNLRRGPSCSS